MTARIAAEKRARDYLSSLGWVEDKGGFKHEKMKLVCPSVHKDARLTLREAVLMEVALRYARQVRISDLINGEPTKN